MSGGSFQLEFTTLIDFANHHDPAVRYFAGTATYRRSLDIAADALTGSQRVVLELGELHDIAGLRVNGKYAGILWHPPYSADITTMLEAGENQLEISVTNNWANCLIGDEQEPADFQWGEDRGLGMGRAMRAYPDWFVKNQPRPSQGRKTFSVWYYYRHDSPLKPAGLIGPVRFVPASEIAVSVHVDHGRDGSPE
jgi:hypothetical protein